ncbi:MAG: biopolymer transporter ExbD [Candidatus Latescibacteria bacterium]|nr:biopolymer transporter ExbD [Candidatus Latescibacterota bacterium]
MVPRSKRIARPAIPTASLPDIAFLLIIFFLVTTTMHMDKGIGLTLPAPGRTTEVPKKNICHIWVNALGEIMCEGEIITISQLREEIKRRLADNPRLIISLKADRDTKYDVFIDVLDQVKLAGAKRISIASPE